MEDADTGSRTVSAEEYEEWGPPPDTLYSHEAPPIPITKNQLRFQEKMNQKIACRTMEQRIESIPDVTIWWLVLGIWVLTARVNGFSATGPVQQWEILGWGINRKYTALQRMIEILVEHRALQGGPS